MTGRPETMTAKAAHNDPQNMMGRVVDFPAQVRGAFELASAGPALLGGTGPRRVFVVGMGGSAIGGDFVRAYAETCSPVPVEVVRGYELPASADESSFAFFVSYSGNTEETLAAWDEAARRRLPRACVTSGGALGERAARDSVPALEIPPGSPPRAALGWTSIPVLYALGKAGVLPFGATEMEAIVSACEESLVAFGPEAPESNEIRRWAVAASSAFPVIYAPARPYAAAATRWACQLNENGKALAHVALFPEQNHNEIVGWEVPSPLHGLAQVAFLVDEATHPRVKKRMQLVAEVVRAAGGTPTWFSPRGTGLLERLYSFAVLGDLASVYVAWTRDVDPTPVASIDRLKAQLEAAAG